MADQLAPRQTSGMATSSQTSSATSSAYSPYLTTFTSLNAFNFLATFTQTIPPEVLTTITTSNNFGFPFTMTTEYPQSELTTYATSNSLGLGYFVTSRISSGPSSSEDSSTSPPTSSSQPSSSTSSGAGPAAGSSSGAPSTQNGNGGNQGLSGGAIAAAVVVPIVVVALIIAALLFFLRKRKQQRQQPTPDAGYHHDSDFSGSAGAKSAPPMSEVDGPITALPRFNGGSTAANTTHSKQAQGQGHTYADPSVSSLHGSDAHPASSGRHSLSQSRGHGHSAVAGTGTGASRTMDTEPIAELPGGDVPDNASIDSDFSFHHAEVADASQARKERASVVQLHAGTPPKSGSPKETGSLA